MMAQEHKDLVRIATYPKYEEADGARTFLLHRGVVVVVVLDSFSVIEDEADLGSTGGLYDLLVAPSDTAKAVLLLDEVWRIEGAGGSHIDLPFATDLPEEQTIEPL